MSKPLSISIVVNPGRFDSIEAAACAEATINWHRDETAAGAITECFAATELRDHLRELCRHAGEEASVSLVAPDHESKADVRIVLGAPETNPLIAAARRRRLIGSIPAGEGCRIASRGRDVFIAGSTRKGVLNGVYRYLEALGMRWTDPHHEQARWPSRVTPNPRGLDLAEAPDFAVRGYYGANGGSAPERVLLWMARNRMNFGGPGLECPALAAKLGIMVVDGGHVFERMTPDRMLDGKRLADAHPDWFAMRRCARTPSRGHLCLSNRHAFECLLDDVEEEILQKAAHLDAYRVWPPDDWKPWCECESCRRLGNASDRYLLVVHELRQRLDRAVRDGRIDHPIILFFLAYEGSDTFAPPLRALPAGFDKALNWMEVWPINRCYAHRLADPRCGELNRHYQRDLIGWRKAFHGPTVMGEYYNVSLFSDMATVFAQVMRADARDYHAAGFAGLEYMHASPGCWGPRSLTNWQLARLLWRARRDDDAMLDEFFLARYGEDGRRMRGLVEQIDRAMSNLIAVKSWLSGSLNNRLRHIYEETTADRTSESPFVYEHLSLHRQTRTGAIGFGYDNLDDCVQAVRRVLAGVRAVRRAGRCPAAAGALAEDEWLLAYTEAMLALHHEFALYWEAAKADSRRTARHARRIRHYADRLAGMEVPEPGLKPEKRPTNGLKRSDLLVPLRRVLGYVMP